MGDRRASYRVMKGRPEEKRSPERPRRRWENSAKANVQEVGWSSMDWINLAQDRNRWRAVVTAVMNLRLP
jgi:hypothetical protein